MPLDGVAVGGVEPAAGDEEFGQRGGGFGGPGGEGAEHPVAGDEPGPQGVQREAQGVVGVHEGTPGKGTDDRGMAALVSPPPPGNATAGRRQGAAVPFAGAGGGGGSSRPKSWREPASKMPSAIC